MLIYMALIGFSVACFALALTARQADTRRRLFLLGLLGMLGTLGLGVAFLMINLYIY